MHLMRLGADDATRRQVAIFEINADTTGSTLHYTEYIVTIPMCVIDQPIRGKRRNFLCKYPEIGLLNCFM